MTGSDLFGVQLRQQQTAILAYQGGLMGVSAVPGSGKTLTLALLAARLIIDGRIGEEGEVLVVTVQNSAVDNISRRIKGILQTQHLPTTGYHVCTLHKLAADILHLRNDVAGVDDSFTIIDQSEQDRLMENATRSWIAGNRSYWESLLSTDDVGQRARLADGWQKETTSIGLKVTEMCKHQRLTPEQARDLVSRAGVTNEFLQIGLDLYATYTSYLSAQNGLDFNDLIWRAITSLEQDVSFERGLRASWSFILEDEAQDSSPLQERILRRLAGPGGNWVRMGDPNQSINSTFTSAEPMFFRRFMAEQGVSCQALPESGRSAQPVIDLANSLVHWVCHEHPDPALRRIAFEEQEIIPTQPGDPQPNPPAQESHLNISHTPFPDVAAQISYVVNKAIEYGKRHPEYSQAILCPAGYQGAKVIEAFEQIIPPPLYDDLLRSTPQTRHVAQVLASIMEYLAQPDKNTLAKHYGLLAQDGYLGPAPSAERLRAHKAILNSAYLDKLLFPTTTDRWRESLSEKVQPLASDLPILERYLQLVARWLRALVLPVDQLLLTIAQDLFTQESDLAIAHALASSLRSIWQMHPEWRLGEYTSELVQVARNKRGVAGFTVADAGYEAQAGHIAVITMHKAKGLEWDVVYLLCVDTLEFPDTCEDYFRNEPYCMPNRAPAEEARTILERLAAGGSEPTDTPTILLETQQEVIAERLRLLYVGITRARRDLSITYSSVNGKHRVRSPLVLRALRGDV